MRKIISILGIFIAFAAVRPVPAFALKTRTIVLKATASGAALGAAAGLVSYPFAKSTSTIFAGAVVGAVLGTVYGFHLADVRKKAFQDQDVARFRRPEFEDLAIDPTLVARAVEEQHRREGGRAPFLFVVPMSFSVE